MDWKSFAKGVLATLIAIALIFGAVAYYRAVDRVDKIHHCELAIMRVEDSPLSHLGELEIQTCVEVGIQIPEGE